MEPLIAKNIEIDLLHYIYYLINDLKKTREIAKNTLIELVSLIDKVGPNKIDKGAETKLFIKARELCKKELQTENFDIKLGDVEMDEDSDVSVSVGNSTISLSEIADKFKKFNSTEKEVILLKIFFDKSYQQIADITETDIATVSGIVNKIISCVAS